MNDVRARHLLEGYERGRKPSTAEFRAVYEHYQQAHLALVAEETDKTRAALKALLDG